jgi:LacI family transcriptional regulator
MRRVALIYDARLSYDRKVMAGVAAYLHENTDHRVYIEGGFDARRLDDLFSGGADGIVANLDHPLTSKAVPQSKAAVVGFGGGYARGAAGSEVAYIFGNSRKIASMAVDHLMERGIRSFAFCGYAMNESNGWSAERAASFAGFLHQRGLGCSRYLEHRESNRPWSSVQERIAAWVASLPKPVGIMAANDSRAQQLLEACRAQGVLVPHEVAVIGVDNDELLCQCSIPSLSSIEHGTHQTGYLAAAMLDRLMRGERVEHHRITVDPVEVVSRQSTDVFAVGDPVAAAANAFIKQHACAGVKVSQVASAVGVSRSKLDAHFTRTFGRGVHVALRKVQLERAQVLIGKTNLPLKQVASEVGLRSVQHMTTLFREFYGQTPGQYRKRVLTSGPAANL